MYDWLTFKKGELENGKENLPYSQTGLHDGGLVRHHFFSLSLLNSLSCTNTHNTARADADVKSGRNGKSKEREKEKMRFAHQFP